MSADVFDEELKEFGGGFLPPTPKMEFLYRMIVDCEMPTDVGQTGKEFLTIIPIIGGKFKGPKISGTVLPIGADWNTTSLINKGSKNVDTRYVLKTDDGAIISLSTYGYFEIGEEAIKRRIAGEIVPPEEIYFKQHLYFETSDEKYKWLNSVVAFGTVISKYKGKPGVIYDAYYLK